MNKEEYALDYCRRNCILIDGIYDYLLDIEWAPQIAVILHKLLSSNECKRWGYVYFAIRESKAFRRVNVSTYYDMLCSTFAFHISHAGVKKGIGLVTDNHNQLTDECKQRMEPIIEAINTVTRTEK